LNRKPAMLAAKDQRSPPPTEFASVQLLNRIRCPVAGDSGQQPPYSLYNFVT
jgi:hypothetical protein